ncbi:MAG TPA: hypothetical protein VL948_13900 [Verrucomicrobiae bacterium]|jgi:hypothetical protein|nr:hypothetical protein [Verrucomicrobiae bacterium]
MKRSIAWLMGLVTAASLLGGCVAVWDPIPHVVVPGPRITVAPAPVVVAPRPWGGYWGYHGHGWQRRAYR